MRKHPLRSIARLHLPLAIGCMLGLSLVPCGASTGAQYVTARRRAHYNPDLTYARVQADAASYVGRVIELKGTVGGMAGTGDGVDIMLNMPGGGSVDLDVPKREAADLHDYVNPNVRVLARVAQGSCGNVVPLVVLALAHESEVAAVERSLMAEWQAEASARKRLHQQQMARRSMSSRQPVQYASRGAYLRSMPGSAAALMSMLGPRVQRIFPRYYDFIASYNSRLNSSDAAQIAAALLGFADQYDVDPRLVVSMVIAESGFNPHATSRVGAAGLGQLMPGTARSLGLNNPYDPIQNLEGSIAYLRSRLSTFGYMGSAEAPALDRSTITKAALAMAAYNAGLGAVRKYGGIPPYRETQAYVHRVIGMYEWLCRDG